MGDLRIRCPWAGDDPPMVRYHDEEWGVPVHDDRALFELLTLEAAQAGLSWRTILYRREGYRAAFRGWHLDRIAAMDERDVQRLLLDPGIVRNRAKIEATIANAQAALRLVDRGLTLDRYLWQFVDEVVIVNRRLAADDVPAQSERSRAMSAQMKRDGFRFLGPTTLYAFMQASGMVNDHLVGCFRHREVAFA